MTSFASDNYAPVHPEVMAAVVAANTGPTPSYGADPWTERLGEVVRATFGDRAAAFPVLTGTGANVVSLMAVSPRWGGVVASRWAHVNCDENGAPERVGGLKVLPIDTPDAKLVPSSLDVYAGDLGDVHRAQPRVVSVTQSTELGSVYSIAELTALADAAHERGMRVHMDGSRLANAAAHLGVSLGELTSGVGVDILSLGGTKNGAMLGEAVVVLDGGGSPGLSAGGGAATERDRASDGGTSAAVAYLRKATMQLASKQRYVSAQLVALLDPAGSPLRTAPGTAARPESGGLDSDDPDSGGLGSGGPDSGGLGSGGPDSGGLGDRDPDSGGLGDRDPLWLRNARHANAMAALLRSRVEGIEGVAVTHPTEANAVFAVLPQVAADRLRATYRFYDWAPGQAPGTVEVRWMCAWDTTAADVEAFTEAIGREVAGA